MANPVWQSADTATGKAVTSLVIPKPSGTVDGNLLLAFIALNITGLVTAPGGWNSGRTDGDASAPVIGLSVFWKIASGEGANFTFTFSSANASGSVHRVTGHSPLAPYHIDNGQTGFNTAMTAPSVTTTVPDCLLFYSVGDHNAAAVTEPSGMTERADVVPSGHSINNEVATLALGAPGATGSKAGTQAGNTLYAAQLIAIAPLTYSLAPPRNRINPALMRVR